MSKMKLFGKLILDSISTSDNLSSTVGEKIFNTEISIKQNNRYSIRDEYVNSSVRKNNNMNSRLYMTSNKDPDRLNLLKTVKNIRESINKNSNNLFQINVGFDDENFRYVYEAKKQLINYRKAKSKRISDKYISLNNFLQDNKHIGINNIILDDLKEENKKLNNRENENKNKIRQGNKDLLENQKSFQNYIRDQNQAYKTIENSLIDINNKSRELLIQKHYHELMKRTIEEEMERILINLEELRESCIFVSKVINSDSGKFEKKIIDKYYRSKLSNPNDKSNLNEITSETIKNYNFCLNQNEEKELKELLNDPNIMMIKFEEIEDVIIRLLDYIQHMKNNEINEKQDRELNMKEMNERLNFYQQDFERINNKYKNEEININNIIKRNKKKQNNYPEYLLKELFNYLLEFENNKNKKSNNPNLQMKDITKKCIKKINEIEHKINNFISDLEKYELEDNKIFSNIISERREYNKDKKYIEQKIKLEEQRQEKGKQSEERLKKSIIQTRKTEAPFRISKKIESNKIIKEDNNEEYDILFY